MEVMVSLRGISYLLLLLLPLGGFGAPGDTTQGKGVTSTTPLPPRLPEEAESTPLPRSNATRGDVKLAAGDEPPPGAAPVEPKEEVGGDDQHKEQPGLSGLSPDALLRGFYVFVGIGTIVMLYIAFKFIRLRRRPSTQKYRILPHTSEQEMVPLAADEGEEEEIYNVAQLQRPLK